jgi:uncharacterized protein YecA (UPF0149 family)
MSGAYICRMQLTRADVDETAKQHAQHDSQLNQNTSEKNMSNMNISRNALCPCGSGLKYKHCHGKLN